MQTMKRISLLLLTLVLLVQLFAGCDSRAEEPSSSATEATTSTSKPSSSEKEETTEPEGDTVATIAPDLTERVKEFKTSTNEETIGWLVLPGTNIEDAVVCHPEDKTNNYYWDKGYDLQYNKTSVYWADYSTIVGDGSREELGVNTCIYGHALTDIPERDSFNTRFGNLHKYRDETFARENPYIYFSTEKEDMVFEIIAVFTANTDNLGVPYNHNDEDGAAFVEMVENEIFPRSKYDYNVELDPDDKFLSLSACIYTRDDGYYTNYPNTYIRYGIMARLVDPDEPLREEADLKLNPNVLYDPDGLWPNA